MVGKQRNCLQREQCLERRPSGDGAREIRALDINAHQFGGVLYAGVPLWKHLNLELGYAQIGRFPLAMTTFTGRCPLSTDAVAQAVVDAAPAAGHAISAGFASALDITSQLSVEPRFAAGSTASLRLIASNRTASRAIVH